MKFLSRISVRAKLGLLVATLATAIVLVATTSLWSLQRAVKVSEMLVTTDMLALRAMADTRAGVGNVRRFEKDLFLNLGDEASLERYHKAWLKQLDDIRERLNAARPSLIAEENALVDSMLAGFVEYAKNVEAILAEIKVGKINDPWAANKALEPSKGAVRAADKALGDLKQSLEQRTQQRVVELSALQSQSGVAIVAAALALVLAAMALAWQVARRITRPLTHAVQAVERVAQGDLTVDVCAEGSDELARLLTGIGAMQGSLAALVGDLRVGIDSVATASAEIASGNSDLSARTEHQAASLQQTAASTAELTGTVRVTAHSARSATERARQVSTVTERSGHEVRAVVATMAEIEQSSRRIAEIIGVIDGIAFQTNILALNAAVEAARAGNHGRGFAVVASEVRALAQRSAEAAQQIKSLIGESVSQVEAGSGLVRTAGATIAQVVTEVQGVTELMAQISTSTGEQDQGLSMIGQSVSQLDEVTQKNAALVEQTAAASESLKDQARRLTEMVGRFRVAPGQTA